MSSPRTTTRSPRHHVTTSPFNVTRSRPPVARGSQRPCPAGAGSSCHGLRWPVGGSPKKISPGKTWGKPREFQRNVRQKPWTYTYTYYIYIHIIYIYIYMESMFKKNILKIHSFFLSKGDLTDLTSKSSRF